MVIKSKKFRENLNKQIIQLNYKHWIDIGLSRRYAETLSKDFFLFNQYMHGMLTKEDLINIAEQEMFK